MDIQVWSSLGQVASTAVNTAAVYLFTVVMVRIAGRRTLAQLSGYDVIVTIALGSLAATAVLPSNVAWSDFAAALLTFLAMQVLIGAVRQRVSLVQRWVDFQPDVIYERGQPNLPSAPWKAQLTRSELESRLRQNGIGGLDEVTLVVLEPTGKMSVSTADDPPPLFHRLRGED